MPPDLHPTRLANPNATRPKARNRDMDSLVDAAWAQGWWCRRTGSGHIMCYPPDKARTGVSVANTPSSPRTFANTRGKMRERGLQL